MQFIQSNQKQQNQLNTKKVIVSRPIVYGNISWWLGPNAEQEKTHKWKCFVRGPQNEDLSIFIEKVGK